MAAVDLDTAKAAQQRLFDLVGTHPAVNGIGIAPVGAAYELKVNVVDPSAQAEVPKEIDGVTVRVRRVGRIRKRRRSAAGSAVRQ